MSNPFSASSESSQPSSDQGQAALERMRRKQGSWVDWGRDCRQVQRLGYTPQAIFEATGFEPTQQNQIVVGVQVYEGLQQAQITPAVLAHFQTRGSDVLYEFRVLPQGERVAAAELALAQGLGAEEAREVARALKLIAQLRSLPQGFSSHPGDAVAYQAWRLARQTHDLQERSRLIARALRFAHTEGARRQVEGLLTDFSSQPLSSPRLPIYRLEGDDPLPRVLPVIGAMPLTKGDLQSVPWVSPEGAFGLVQFTGEGAWVALPGWPAIMGATDPLVLLWDAQQLALARGESAQTEESETILMVVDRADRDWQPDGYYLIASSPEETLEVTWFEEAPGIALLGRVLMAVRPPRIFDEVMTEELWMTDE